jgi:hypothetical protein
MELEYLTSNGLNRYPFVDNCNFLDGTFSGDPFPFPNDFILELLLVSKAADAVYAKFVNYSLFLTNLYFTFQVCDKNGNGLFNASIIIPVSGLEANVLSRTFYSRDTSDYYMKILLGPGVLTDTVDHTAAYNNILICPSAFIPAIPRVKSIAFYNLSDLVHTVDADDLIIEEGANLSFTKTGTNTMSVAVIRNAGTGLYNACDDTLYLKSINNIKGSLSNNFLLNTDDCYTSEKGILSGTVNRLAILPTNWIGSPPSSVTQVAAPLDLSISAIANTTYVLNLVDLILSGSASILTFSGNNQDNVKYIINVARFFSLSGGSSIVLTNGLVPTDIIFNVLPDPYSTYTYDATLGRGSHISGILIAKNRSIKLTSASSINGQGIGNALLLSGGSTITGGYSKIIDHGLTLSNICTPKCTKDQLGDFAHYVNRIKDGLSKVNSYVTTVVNDFNTYVNNWVTTVYPEKNKPYYKISYSKFEVPYPTNSYYYSFVVGFFNPKSIPIHATAAVTLVSSGMTFKSGSFRFKTQDGAVLLPEAVMEGTIPCLSVGRFEFVVHSLTGKVITIHGVIDSTTISETITLDTPPIV